jgi:hypothetical protein
LGLVYLHLESGLSVLIRIRIPITAVVIFLLPKSLFAGGDKAAVKMYNTVYISLHMARKVES